MSVERQSSIFGGGDECTFGQMISHKQSRYKVYAPNGIANVSRDGRFLRRHDCTGHNGGTDLDPESGEMFETQCIYCLFLGYC